MESTISCIFAAVMRLLKRKWTILFLLIVVPAGFYSKFYTGPASDWVNNSLGGVFYVVFWSLLFYLLLPKVQPGKTALAAFVATCAVETLQLWHPAFLETIRRNFIGATILGSTFSWLDMLHYIIGFLASWALLGWLRRLEG
jgi:hypothetical protein